MNLRAINFAVNLLALVGARVVCELFMLLQKPSLAVQVESAIYNLKSFLYDARSGALKNLTETYYPP